MRFKFYALWICFICVGIFILQLVVGGFTEIFLLNRSAFGEYWRFLTAIFLHGDMGHLLYNLFALAFFGNILEKLIGGKKFLIVFFVTGILANLISINFYESSLGASGAIFGIIGALIIIRPGMMVFAFGLPMPMFFAGILWVIGDIIGIFTPSGTANIAHLAGMFFGLIFGAFFRQVKEKIGAKNVYVNEDEIRKWENEYFR